MISRVIILLAALVAGVLPAAGPPSGRAYFSCQEILEIEGLFVRRLERGDLDDVAAFLSPTRTPATRWRETYVAERAKGNKPGLIVRGGDDHPIAAVLVWRPTAEGIEILELEVARGYRHLSLDAWLLRRLQRELGPDKAIRMVIADLDARRALDLSAAGFVLESVDPTGVEMPGLLDGHVYVFEPPGGRPRRRSAVEIGLIADGEYRAIQRLARNEYGAEAADTLLSYVHRALFHGTIRNIVVAREGNEVRSFALYLASPVTGRLQIFYSLVEKLSARDERRFVRFLADEAKRLGMREVAIDMSEHSGDYAAYLRGGFRRAGEGGSSFLVFPASR